MQHLKPENQNNSKLQYLEDCASFVVKWSWPHLTNHKTPRNNFNEII